MSAPKPPCACRHFHGLHIPAAANAGRCTGPGCDCQAYTRPTTRPDERLTPDDYIDGIPFINPDAEAEHQQAVRTHLAMATPETDGTCYYDRHPEEPCPPLRVVLDALAETRAAAAGGPDAPAPAVADLAVPDDRPGRAGVGDLAVIPEWADEWASGVTCCGGPAVRIQAWNGTWHTACSVSGWGIEKCPDGRSERDE